MNGIWNESFAIQIARGVVERRYHEILMDYNHLSDGDLRQIISIEMERAKLKLKGDAFVNGLPVEMNWIKGYTWNKIVDNEVASIIIGHPFKIGQPTNYPKPLEREKEYIYRSCIINSKSRLIANRQVHEGFIQYVFNGTSRHLFQFNFGNEYQGNFSGETLIKTGTLNTLITGYTHVINFHGFEIYSKIDEFNERYIFGKTNEIF
jgi:hypothetical protein